MSMPRDESDRPDVVQRAADAGMKAIAASLEAEGARAEHIFITLHAEGVPEGELEACTAGEGFDDAQDLAGHLLGAALSVCDEIGIDLPHRVGPPQGPRLMPPEFDPTAIREAMLAIEARSEREEGALPVGQFLAEQLGIEWSEAFDEMVLAETARALDLMSGYYLDRGLPWTIHTAVGLGVVQGVTLALAVQELRERR